MSTKFLGHIRFSFIGSQRVIASAAFVMSNPSLAIITN
jgi:hypothetical protein